MRSSKTLSHGGASSMEDVSHILRLLGGDVSFRRFAILLACKTVSGPQTNKDLADHFGVSEGGMSLSISRLEEVGLVERISHPHNDRGLLVKVTKKGDRLVQMLSAWRSP
jgi:DNA-binding MarR family transcriptional regulator